LKNGGEHGDEFEEEEEDEEYEEEVEGETFVRVGNSDEVADAHKRTSNDLTMKNQKPNSILEEQIPQSLQQLDKAAEDLIDVVVGCKFGQEFEDDIKDMLFMIQAM